MKYILLSMFILNFSALGSAITPKCHLGRDIIDDIPPCTKTIKGENLYQTTDPLTSKRRKFRKFGKLLIRYQNDKPLDLNLRFIDSKGIERFPTKSSHYSYGKRKTKKGIQYEFEYPKIIMEFILVIDKNIPLKNIKKVKNHFPKITKLNKDEALKTRELILERNDKSKYRNIYYIGKYKEKAMYNYYLSNYNDFKILYRELISESRIPSKDNTPHTYKQFIFDKDYNYLFMLVGDIGPSKFHPAYTFSLHGIEYLAAYSGFYNQEKEGLHSTIEIHTYGALYLFFKINGKYYKRGMIDREHILSL